MKNFNRKILMIIITSMMFMGIQTDLCAMGRKRISAGQPIDALEIKRLKAEQQTCHVCGESFPSARSLAGHMGSHKRAPRQAAKNPVLNHQLQCLCSHICADEQSYKEHAQACIGLKFGTAHSQPIVLQPSPAPLQPLPTIECPYDFCNEQFIDQDQCDNHYQSHLIAQCNKCNQSFETEELLVRHARECDQNREEILAIDQPPRTIKCLLATCNVYFRDQKERDDHYQSHLVQCNTCNQSFETKSLLKEHSRKCNRAHREAMFLLQVAQQAYDDYDPNRFLNKEYL